MLPTGAVSEHAGQVEEAEFPANRPCNLGPWPDIPLLAVPGFRRIDMAGTGFDAFRGPRSSLLHRSAGSKALAVRCLIDFAPDTPAGLRPPTNRGVGGIVGGPRENRLEADCRCYGRLGSKAVRIGVIVGASATLGDLP